MKPGTRKYLQMQMTIGIRIEPFHTSFKIASDKYRKFSSKDLSQDKVDEEIDELLNSKEKERSELNTSVANLFAEVQTANKAKEDMIRDKQAKQREVECESLSYLYTPSWLRMLPAINKKIKAELTDDLEDLTYEDALKAVAEEVDLRRRDVLIGQANEVYENLIKVSKREKKCQACNRQMNDRDMATMEKTVRASLVY